MVDTQVRPSDVTKFPIIQQLLTVRREAYVSANLVPVAYADEDLDLGGRVLLAPRTFAKMLDAVDVQPNDVVLDIGCGLGYTSAVLAGLALAVVAVEDDQARVAEAQSVLSEEGVDNAAVIAGPLAEGQAGSGPYDVIMIEGGIEHWPDALTDQLVDGGRAIAVWLEGRLAVVRVGLKSDGKMNWRDSFNAGAPLLEGFELPRVFAL